MTDHQKNTLNLQKIISDVQHNKMLLPDFQRKFVWTEENRQKRIVASVLTKMPIGSILLLESLPTEYCSKIIGNKNTIDTKDLKEKVKFLLDGQQRITVLTNVFSNVIHNNSKQVLDLISTTLKRRFFLRIPKWVHIKDNITDGATDSEADLFGVRTLDFTYKEPDYNDPDFLSGDIYPFIHCESFKADDKNPFNPRRELSTELDSFCINYKEGYLVPLYLIAYSCDKKPSQSEVRYLTIIKNISENIKNEINNYFCGRNF